MNIKTQVYSKSCLKRSMKRKAIVVVGDVTMTTGAVAVAVVVAIVAAGAMMMTLTMSAVADTAVDTVAAVDVEIEMTGHLPPRHESDMTMMIITRKKEEEVVVRNVTAVVIHVVVVDHALPLQDPLPQNIAKIKVIL